MTEVIEEGEEGSPVVSERVQALAQGIYGEFQSMMEEYGPESIGNIMPLVINVLENLDSALADNQDHLTALMEVNEENQQLTKQYDREKHRRREIEEKAMRLEDVSEQELREAKENNNHLVLENKDLNTRLKSQKDHAERVEEKYEQIKRDKKELHDRNIELIRNFHTQMETLKSMKMSEARTKPQEDVPGSPRAPGFKDFLTPVKGKKKRHLPVAPRRRARTNSGGEGDDVMFLATTPAQRPDSPEYIKLARTSSPPNLRSLHDEQSVELEDEEEVEEEEEELYAEGEEVEVIPGRFAEEFAPNEDSLLEEMHMAGSGSNLPGVDDIIQENEQLMSERGEMTKELEELMGKLRETENVCQRAESSAASLQSEKEALTARVGELEGETKKLRRELEDEQDKTSGIMREGSDKAVGPDGLRLTRLEVARVLRERNEYKEKYLSLLEQIRMNDELYLFKRKEKKSSRWLDYFAALFSPAKRRQMEKTDGTSRRPILGARKSPEGGVDEEDGGGHPQIGAAGFSRTKIIPTLRKMGKRQDEVYMTSVSWVLPAVDQHHDGDTSPSSPQPTAPNINTCRPMSYQEDGAKLLCAAAVNPATFLEDGLRAIRVRKDTALNSSLPPNNQDESSMSLVWIVTGVPNLTKVSIIDAAAVGEVLETFPVSSGPIQCIAAIPEFDEQDPDVLTGLSNHRRKPTPPQLQSSLSDRPSSKHTTMWMGSDAGVLYVHSAISQWKKCIHADKLPAGIQSIAHDKGKAFLLLQNASLAVFRRFPDGDWDWDNYSIVVLSQRKDLASSAMAAVKFNVWCAVGNTITVVHSHMLKLEATFTVHSRKRAEVNQMVTVGDGVWISFSYDSTLRLFHATTFTHMQDLDIATSIHKTLVFGSERRSAHMAIQVSALVAGHNGLWVGTENGVLIAYPFTAPTIVTEESGWELVKEAEVSGSVVPEPFDVRTEHGEEVGVEEGAQAKRTLKPSADSKGSSPTPTGTLPESPLPDAKTEEPKPKPQLQMESPHMKTFSPFCNVDQVQLSIHCHINGIRNLTCVPGLVPKDLAMYEPLGGVYIGSGDVSDCKPALFVVSCGEGHLDLRTADKVLQTLHAKEAGDSGLPSAASILSEKNYIMVWEIVV